MFSIILNNINYVKTDIYIYDAMNFSKSYFNIARFAFFYFIKKKFRSTYGVNRSFPSLRATLDIRVN